MSNVKSSDDFRDYDKLEQENDVVATYRAQHTNQTMDFVMNQYSKYFGGSSSGGSTRDVQMDLWDIYKYLQTKVDKSDPDTGAVQMYHAIQTGEALRSSFPGDKYKWLHLTGFLHDFGKIMSKWDEPEWAVVGDTFPVGCAFDKDNIFYDFFKENPDYKNPDYNTKYGIYQPNCGFDKVYMSWGHDEYWASVLENNCDKHLLPDISIYLIRFHSFYPWHQKMAYSHLASSTDYDNFGWLLAHQKCDLYSKDEDDEGLARCEEKLPYYQGLVNEFFSDTKLQL